MPDQYSAHPDAHVGLHERNAPARHLRVGLAAAFVLCAPAQAAETLPPLLISASHLPLAAERVPGAATIITRADIEARPGATVVDLLRHVAGLHVDAPGGRGGVASVYLRGADPNFTRVAIDGVRVNDPTNTRGGSYDFSVLDAEQIERIEIVRGPLSAVHGADALAGSINIVTRAGAAGHHANVSGGYGSRGYHRGDASALGTLPDGTRYAWSAATLDNGTDAPLSAFETHQVAGKFSGEIGEGHEWQGFLRYANSRASRLPDDSGGPEFSVLRDPERRDSAELNAGADWSSALGERLDLRLAANAYLRDEDQDSPGVAPGVRDPFGIPPNRSDNRFERYAVDAAITTQVFANTMLVTGLETQFEDGESESVLDFGFPVSGDFGLSRTTVSGYTELQHAWADWLFNLGARVDKVDEVSSELSPRLALSRSFPRTDTVLRASYGEGFKPPSFFALGNPIVGNSELVAETSRSFDVGLVQSFNGGRMRLEFNLFDSRYFDIIDLEETPTLRLVNRDEVRSRGGELIGSLRLTETLRTDAHLSYVDTDIRGTTESLRNRPQWRGGWSVLWTPREVWSLYAGLLAVGDAHDSSIPTGDRTLDEYLRLDVVANWNMSRHWSWSLALDNLTGTDYEEAVGFPAPDTSFRLSARVKL